MKTLFKIFAALLLLFVVLIVIVLFLPDQQYQYIAKNLIEKSTGREVVIEDLVTTRSLNPSLEIKDFSMSNAHWTDRGKMINAGNVFISVDLKRLLEGKLHVNKLSADKVSVDLLRNLDGKANWQFKKHSDESAETFDKELLTRIILSEVNLADIQLNFLDQQKKLKYRLELPGFELARDAQAVDLQNITAQGVFNDLPFSISGKTGLIDSLVKNKLFPFDITSKLNESDFQIQGQVVDQSGDLQLNTSVAAQTQSLNDLSVFTVNTLPSIGPIALSADIAGNLKAISETGIDVNELHVNVNDPSIKLDVNGNLSALGAENAGDVSISLDVNELTKLSQLFGLQRELPGTLTLNATAAGSGEDFGMKIEQASLESPFLSASLNGQVEDLFDSRATDISIDASAPNLDIVTEFFGVKMPPQWGPIQASATLNGANYQYALEDIVAQLDGNSKLKATGRIDQLLKFDGMALDVEATLASLEEISAFTKKPLPHLGPITAKGKINWGQGKLSLVDATANYNGDYGNADVKGSIGDLIKFDIVRLKAVADIPDLDVAQLFSGVQMPELKSIQASADLVSPTALDLSAKNLKASYEADGINVKATGSIDSMIKNLAVLNLDVESTIESLASVNPLFNAKLPAIGPLSATAKLTGSEKNISLDNVDILLSDSAIYGSLKGDLGKLSDLKGISMDVDLTTPSIDLLFNRLDLKSTVKKPLNLSSHVSYEADAFKFEKSELDIGGDKIIGDLSFINFLDKNARPKVVGKINVLNFNARDLAGEDINKVEKQNTDKFLSKTLLPYEFIETTDLDLNFNIGRLRGNVFDFTNSTVEIHSTNGRFKLGPFKGKLSGGDAAFQVDIDARSRPTRTKLNVDIEGFNMAQAGAFRDAEQIESTGDAFLNFKLDAKGRTLASIMANANGSGALYFEDLLLKRGTLDLFTSDLFKKTLNAINPFKKEQKDTQINCAALAFNIDDGLLTTPFGVAAEASEYSVTGKGRVDFKTEAIDLEFKTKVKKLLAINPLEKLTGLVKVVGEMTEPVVTLNPKGIFEIGATVGAAIATGGLSFLAQDQLEKLNAKTELCSKALGKIAPVVQPSQQLKKAQ